MNSFKQKLSLQRTRKYGLLKEKKNTQKINRNRPRGDTDIGLISCLQTNCVKWGEEHTPPTFPGMAERSTFGFTPPG